jgi:hypothetical protein
MNLNTSTSTIQALKALVALAELELGEAALTLGDRLDKRSDATRETALREEVMNKLGQVHERMTQPSVLVNTAAMSVLARQTMSGKAALFQARQQQNEAERLVDAQRQEVHQHQNRHEGLKKGLRDAMKAHAAMRDNKLAQDVEDLFLARRIHLGVHA